MRPRLKRTIEPVETPSGDVVLIRSGGEDVRISHPDAEERAMLEALDGSQSVEDLEARYGHREVDDTLAQMSELALIEDAGDDDLLSASELERFDRQLRYFSDMGGKAAPPPSECQARLREARVAILGVGGLGGRVAFELAACGIGKLRLIDGDRVEVSNLNRQIQFTEADVGRLKVEMMAARLKGLNSRVEITTIASRMESQAQVAACVAGADVVVGAADWPAYEIEDWCNAACFEASIPYISMAQFPPKVKVGPLYVPGKSGCYECQKVAWRREHPMFDIVVDQLKGKSSAAATLAPSSGLIGAQVGMDVVHFVTGLVEPASLRTACLYDLRTMEVERVPVKPVPDCPICSHLLEAAPT
jgi:bacteriocin biosynthesis cyclodehydratase domain-containing protein